MYTDRNVTGFFIRDSKVTVDRQLATIDRSRCLRRDRPTASDREIHQVQTSKETQRHTETQRERCLPKTINVGAIEYNYKCMHPDHRSLRS